MQADQLALVARYFSFATLDSGLVVTLGARALRKFEQSISKDSPDGVEDVVLLRCCYRVLQDHSHPNRKSLFHRQKSADSPLVLNGMSAHDQSVWLRFLKFSPTEEVSVAIAERILGIPEALVAEAHEVSLSIVGFRLSRVAQRLGEFAQQPQTAKASASFSKADQ